ncbi:ubiquitin fusion degradation protein [Balamuthia mandrillaris]
MEQPQQQQPQAQRPLPSGGGGGGGLRKANDRLFNELKRCLDVDRCLKSGFVAKPVADDLFHWHVRLFDFFPDSRIARDLELRCPRGGEEESQGEEALPPHVLLEFRFDEDYPIRPPSSVRVVRPRLMPSPFFLLSSPSSSSVVDAGGNIHLDLFSTSEWTPIQTLASMATLIKTKLVDEGIGVFPPESPPYSLDEALSARDGFYRIYCCNSASFKDRLDLNYSGKILLPPSALQEIVTKDVMEQHQPLIFELLNASNGRTTFGGVMEFMAEESHVYIPSWMTETLLLEEGQPLNVRLVRGLPKGTFVKFKAQDEGFYKLCPDPKPMSVFLCLVFSPFELFSNSYILYLPKSFETVLRNFAALKEGDRICIEFDKQPFFFDVLETRPEPCIDINNVDIEVEFLRITTVPASSFAVASDAKQEPKEKEKEAGKEQSKGYRLNDPSTSNNGPSNIETSPCPTCKRDIPIASLAMHSAFCERHNYCCLKCGHAVRLSERQQHEDEFHALTECEDCGEKMEMDELPRHLEEKCIYRMERCPYCNLAQRAVELDSHKDYCGNRTEQCDRCNKCIKYKDLEMHLSSGCTYPASTQTSAPSAFSSLWNSATFSNPQNTSTQNSSAASAFWRPFSSWW